MTGTQEASWVMVSGASGRSGWAPLASKVNHRVDSPWKGLWVKLLPLHLGSGYLDNPWISSEKHPSLHRTPLPQRKLVVLPGQQGSTGTM